IGTLLPQPSPLPSLSPLLSRLLLPPPATAVPPLLFITAGHPCHLPLQPLQPTVAASFLQPPAALGRTHPHGHHLFLAFPLLPCSSPAAAATRRGPLPAILPRCHCFPATSSALLLPPTPSSSPSTHSSAASASCCRSASVPLSLLPPPPCCGSRFQPCPHHLLPSAATSATPRRTLLLVDPAAPTSSSSLDPVAHRNPLPFLVVQHLHNHCASPITQTHIPDSTAEKRIEQIYNPTQ
ncbi:hypothetical protein BHE74_00042554, partial [Ensete ventricosum]